MVQWLWCPVLSQDMGTGSDPDAHAVLACKHLLTKCVTLQMYRNHKVKTRQW